MVRIVIRAGDWEGTKTKQGGNGQSIGTQWRGKIRNGKLWMGLDGNRRGGEDSEGTVSGWRRQRRV